MTGLSVLRAVDDGYMLDLGYPPAPPLSENRAGGHWARRRSSCKPWRELAHTLARGSRLAQHVAARPCLVEVHIPFDTERRRDPANYVGTVVKACVDGLVSAGVWPDDTPDFVTVLEPILTRDGTCAIHLTWRPA